MQNSYLILKQVTNDLKNIDGIGFYSIFQLPFEDSSDSFLKMKKNKAFFCFEGFVIKNKEDING